MGEAPGSIAAEMEMMKSKHEKLVSNYEAALDEIKELKKIIKSTAKTANYYDNSNTPPSADSIEWRKQRRQKDKERKDNGNTGKKAGGKKGHKGVSRNHDPEKTEHYKFERKRVDGKIKRMLPTCTCGSDMRSYA